MNRIKHNTVRALTPMELRNLRSAPQVLVEVQLKKRHEPTEFYRRDTRSKVLSGTPDSPTDDRQEVPGTFYDVFVKNIESTHPPAKINLAYVDVMAENFPDGIIVQQLTEVLPGSQDIKKTDMSWIIAEMITNQSNGQGGVLLTDGKPNIFKSKSMVVELQWGKDQQKWCFRCGASSTRKLKARFFVMKDPDSKKK